MAAKKKILLSGIQPTGRLHIGNYLGAMKQFVDLQDQYESYISIVNYHALTSVEDPYKLWDDTIEAALDHLALGLDPKKVTLFLQSDVPQLTELAWVFNTLITVPYLSRAHAYKDKVEKGLEATVGLFDYPVLMAADILLPEAVIVPVGSDQKQHVEIARDIATKFNNTFGDTFPLPEALILDEGASVPGTDGQKMSKSYKNTIPLFETDEELERAVMSIVTDSKDVRDPKNPDKDTIFALHVFFSKDQLGELRKRYTEGSIGYRESKEILLENLKTFLAPFRERRRELEENLGEVEKILQEGGKVMREKAEKKMNGVRRKIGVRK